MVGYLNHDDTGMLKTAALLWITAAPEMPAALGFLSVCCQGELRNGIVV